MRVSQFICLIGKDTYAEGCRKIASLDSLNPDWDRKNRKNEKKNWLMKKKHSWIAKHFDFNLFVDILNYWMRGYRMQWLLSKPIGAKDCN